MQRMVYVPPGGNVELPETCVEFSLAPPYIIGSVTGTGGPETTVISSSVPGAVSYTHLGGTAREKELVPLGFK